MLDLATLTRLNDDFIAHLDKVAAQEAYTAMTLALARTARHTASPTLPATDFEAHLDTAQAADSYTALMQTIQYTTHEHTGG